MTHKQVFGGTTDDGPCSIERLNPSESNENQNLMQTHEKNTSSENSPIAMRAGRRTEILKQKQIERQRLAEV